MSEDFDGWLTKREAAQALGCAEKTVERMAARGQIQQGTRKRPGAASVAVFHPGDVERVQLEQQAAAKPGAFPVPAAAENVRLTLQNTETTPAMDRFLAALETLLSRQAPALPAPDAQLHTGSDTKLPTLTELSVKPVLRLAEAQRLTGIPRSILLEAIKTGKLKADDKKFGRGWRIKRTDLDSYLSES